MIIALYSPAPQSGKTTLAQYLMSAWGFERVRFAEPLKAMTKSLLHHMGFGEPIIARMVDGDLKDNPIPGFSFKSRDIMQTLGTNWGREAVEKDLWVNVAISRIETLYRLGRRDGYTPKIVIDDMRFPNEYAALKGQGAKMVRVLRPSVMMPESRLKSGYEGLLNDHEFDLTINNDGELDDLYDAIGYFYRCGGIVTPRAENPIISPSA